MRKKTNDKRVSNEKLYDDILQKITLSAIFNRVYVDKVSKEIINTKVNNQINSIKVSINQINSKFCEKSKNYDKVKDDIMKLIEKYEDVLKEFCYIYDIKIEQYILKKIELENKLLTNIIDSEDEILDTEKKIKKVTKIISKLNEEKINKVYEAMEMGGKEISTQIRRPKQIKNIVKFFSNKFNTYKIIEKNVINSLNIKIEEFENKMLSEKNKNKQEFDLKKFEQNIEKYKINIKNKKK